MTDIEWIDTNDELSGFVEELSDLKNGIKSSWNETTINSLDSRKSVQENFDEKIWKRIMKEIDICWKNFFIPEEIIDSFKEEVKKYSRKELAENDDYANDYFLKSLFWDKCSCLKEEIYDQSFSSYLFPYYLKSLWLSNYASIIKQIKPIFIWLEYVERPEMINMNLNNQDFYGKIYWFLEKHWDKSETYLQYLAPHTWSYIHNWSLLLNAWEKKEDLEWLASVTQFFEIFINEPESINLFEFLNSNPQKLSNLWWKMIKEIDLNTSKWINFCFRWIIEMVKSRADLSFPHLNNYATKQEEEKRKFDWLNIIKEYEKTLKEYISKDFTTDGQWEIVEKPREQTFDKIFYARPLWDETIDKFHVDNKTLQSLSTNNIADYSYAKKDIEDVWDWNLWWEKSLNKQDQILKDIEKYVSLHPHEQILVCIDEHWDKDWSSLNWWSKEDRLRLANLSPNIKIWSFRCYFWTAFESDTITNQISSVSWYSNQSPTSGQVSNIINEASKLWLWYHEMELYVRLNYLQSISPLTESMEYTNRNTWETEIWKIGLAQNDNQNNNSDVTYA